jgi:hypothetical protein
MLPRDREPARVEKKKEKKVMEARVQRARAHERAARMYSGFGEKSKALAHARRALFLRFGTPPRLEVSQDAYDKLVKEKRDHDGRVRAAKGQSVPGFRRTLPIPTMENGQRSATAPPASSWS